MISILENNAPLSSAIQQVAEVAGYLWQKGWAERNGGNITVNITDLVNEELRACEPISAPLSIGTTLPHLHGCYFYCKGTGRRMRDLARWPMDNGSIIRIQPDCASYVIVATKPIHPTSELPSHLTLHNYLLESGSKYRAVLHTHPIELVAMSHNREMLGKDVMTHLLWSMIPETLAFAPLGLGIVPYEIPGSVELADATLEQVRHYDVVLWEKHGVCAVGQDIMDAFDQVDCLNKSAQIYMSARTMGFIPEGMTPQAMADVQRVFHLPNKRPC